VSRDANPMALQRNTATRPNLTNKLGYVYDSCAFTFNINLHCFVTIFHYNSILQTKLDYRVQTHAGRSVA